MNETLSPRRRALSKRVFDYSSSPFFLVFFFFFHDSLRRGAAPSEKRVVKPWRGPTVVQSLELRHLPFLSPSLTISLLPSSDSFHSSAFDHPRWRIRYSNASELSPFTSPYFPLSLVPFVLNLILSIYLSPFRSVTSPLAAGSSNLSVEPSLFRASFFFLSFFHIYHRRAVCIRE